MTARLPRRLFLKAIAGASAVAWLGKATVAGATESVLDIPLGLQLYSLRTFDLDAALDAIRDLGLTRVEFHSKMLEPTWSAEQIDAVLAKVQARDLKISAFSMPKFSDDHDKNRQIFEFARRAGIRNLTSDPNPESFDSLDKLVEEYNIRVAIHNHGPRHRYNKAVDVVQAYRDHHPRIGACADLGHFIRSGEDPIAAMRLYGDRLYGVHLKDFAQQQDVADSIVLGQGHLDVVGVYRALKEVNFPADGALSIEYEGQPDDPLPDIRASLEVARQAAMQVG